jgi:hypothetical protein
MHRYNPEKHGHILRIFWTYGTVSGNFLDNVSRKTTVIFQNVSVSCIGAIQKNMATF